MKQYLKLLFISLILFSSNVFGVLLQNQTNYKINVILDSGNIRVIESKKTSGIKDTELKKVLRIKFDDSEETHVINLSAKMPKRIVFENEGEQIVISGDGAGELVRINIKADDEDSEHSGGASDEDDDLLSSSSTEDTEEESDSKDKKDLKKGSSLLTLKNFAIVGVLGAAGYFAWNYYQNSQKKQK